MKFYEKRSLEWKIMRFLRFFRKIAKKIFFLCVSFPFIIRRISGFEQKK